MGIDWDLTKLPRRPSEWASFVDVLAEQQRTNAPFEDFWLEQKSAIDPLKSPGLGKIAKCMLGMANREPATASRALGGHGLMVCGLSDGRRVGVRRTEDHQLENVLSPFLGPDGPIWTAHRVPAEDKDHEVLIFMVDPPQDGDPIYVCSKESDGVKDGGVYVRSRTETREARSAEHRALQQRTLNGRVKPDLDIEVQLTSSLFAVRWDSNLLDDYLAETETVLLASLTTSSSSSRLSIQRSPTLQAIWGSLVEREEDRSEDQFRNEIAAWVKASRHRTNRVAARYLARTLPGAVFQITNRSNVFLKNVEVSIHLEGEVKSLPYSSDKRMKLAGILPERPRKYGPYEVTPASISPQQSFPASNDVARARQTNFRNSGSVDVTFTPSALRPQSSITTDADESVLFLPGDSEVQGVRGTWRLTAEGIDDVYSGELWVPIEKTFVLKPRQFAGQVVGIPQTLRVNQP